MPDVLCVSILPTVLGRRENTAGAVEHAVDPEEAFIASVASCHMLFFLDYAAQGGFMVDAYDDAASGTLAPDATGRLWVEAIVLAPRIRFSGDRIPSREEIAALHERAHHDCFIANSVKSTITVIEASD